MKQDQLFRSVEMIENEEVFAELLKVVAEKGKVFRPKNYVWDLLPVSLAVKKMVPPEDMVPGDISPVLVASFIEFGQILPVWVDKQGRVIEGRARALFFGPNTRYLVHPESLSFQERVEVRFSPGKITDVVKRLAEKIGVEFWREEVG